MQTRQLGHTELRPGIIGLGLEHLNGQPRETVCEVIAHALDRGVNFLDLIAWTADVQQCVGEVIAGRRERVILAGHLGMAETGGQYRRTREVAESRQCLEAQLDRLGTDYLDILYCPHNCDDPADLEAMLGPGGLMTLARALCDSGLARYLGFSGHSYPLAAQALEATAPAVMMLPVNPTVAMAPEAIAVLQQCQRRGVGVVAMKTYAGGVLFERCPDLTPQDCLSFALGQPAVAVAAVGCRTVAELDAALAYLGRASDVRDTGRAVEGAREAAPGQCTYCHHCEPCPVGIEVAAVHRLLAAAENGVSSELRARYLALAVDPADCIGCEACTERCPFGVQAAENIRRAARWFA